MPINRQRALLQLVREVSRRQIAPRAEHHVPGDAFPAELFALLAELDLLGLPFSSDDGGLGQPTTVVCQVLTELSQAFLAVGLGTWVHLLATRIVADHASSSLREEVLPQLIAGEWLAAHALTVPTTAPTVSPSMRLTRDGDGYVVNGALSDVAHAGQADCYVLLGRLSDRPDDGGTMLLVTADAAGLECALSGSRATIHGAAAGPLTCRDVVVPAHHRLGAEGDGARIAADAVDLAHLGVASCVVGLARAALQVAVAGVRVSGRGGSLADGWSDVADTIADLAAAVEAADALCGRAAAADEAGQPVAALAAMARIMATRTAIEVTDRVAGIDGVGGSAAAAAGDRYRREAAALHLVDGRDSAARRALVGEVVGDLERG
jgi:alkylation response protein AidB-like acyl-CoA dehydrogenase